MRRNGIIAGLLLGTAALGAAAVWTADRGGWWWVPAIAAGIAAAALLVAVIGFVKDPGSVDAERAGHHAEDGGYHVSAAAEEAVRRPLRTGPASGLPGPDGRIIAPIDRPWESGRLPGHDAANRGPNRAQRRGEDRAQQRRETKIRQAQQRTDRRSR